jgi:hypothetical protein
MFGGYSFIVVPVNNIDTKIWGYFKISFVMACVGKLDANLEG